MRFVLVTSLLLYFSIRQVYRHTCTHMHTRTHSQRWTPTQNILYTQILFFCSMLPSWPSTVGKRHIFNLAWRDLLTLNKPILLPASILLIPKYLRPRTAKPGGRKGEGIYKKINKASQERPLNADLDYKLRHPNDRPQTSTAKVAMKTKWVERYDWMLPIW